jgi:hypothetical protein
MSNYFDFIGPIEYFLFLFYYVLWILAFLGIGNISIIFIKDRIRCSYLNNEFFENQNHLMLIISGIAGMAIVTTITTIINFFAPINLTISLILVTIGVFSFYICRKNITSNFYIYEKIYLMFLAVIIYLVVPLVWISWYDTGMYHLPTIKWIIESSVPLGLANLHGRLGFNCSWFVLSAVIDQMVSYLNKPYFLINAILYFFYSSTIMFVIIRKFFVRKMDNGNLKIKISDNNKINKINLSDIFLILSAVSLIYPGLMFLSSPTPDFPIMIFTLFTLFLLICDIEHNLSEDFFIFVATSVSMYAITVKLSSLMLIFTVMLFFIFRNWLKRHLLNKNQKSDKNRKNTSNIPLFIIICSFSLLVPWMIRGLLLSGCLFFPFLVGYFPNLPWAVPAPLAISEVKWTQAWARLPAPDSLSSLNNWDWVKGWLLRYLNFDGWSHLPWGDITSLSEIHNSYDLIIQNIIYAFIYPVSELYVPLIIFITGVFCLIFFAYNNLRYVKEVLIKHIIYLIPLIISLSGILFWFYSAPDLRFGFGFIYSFVLYTISIAAMLYITNNPKKDGKNTNVIIIKRRKRFATILSITLLVYGSCIVYYYATNTAKWGSDGFNFPETNLTEKKTVDGTVIYIVTDNYPLFWNGPLPNTPYFNENLRTIMSNSTNLPMMFWYDDKSSLPILLFSGFLIDCSQC